MLPTSGRSASSSLAPLALKSMASTLRPSGVLGSGKRVIYRDDREELVGVGQRLLRLRERMTALQSADRIMATRPVASVMSEAQALTSELSELLQATLDGRSSLRMETLEEAERKVDRAERLGSYSDDQHVRSWLEKLLDARAAKVQSKAWRSFWAAAELRQFVEMATSAQDALNSCTRDAIDWAARHAAVERALEETEATMEALEQADKLVVAGMQRKREAWERQQMTIEEVSQRRRMRAMAKAEEEAEERAAFIHDCRGYWQAGMKLREEDAVAAEKAAAAAEAEAAAEAARRAAEVEERRSRRDVDGTLLTAWAAAKGGASLVRMEELLVEEIKLRKFQERRSFHIDDRCSETGELLLHNACWGGHAHLVSHFLAMGANVNLRDRYAAHATPLHLAARAGSAACVRILMAAGASITAQDDSGETALHWAARKSWLPVLLELLQPEPEDDLSEDSALWRMVGTRNDRGALPSEVATREDVIGVLVEHEMELHKRKQLTREKRRAKLAAHKRRKRTVVARRRPPRMYSSPDSLAVLLRRSLGEGE